jgi:hypothetical protein
MPSLVKPRMVYQVRPVRDSFTFLQYTGSIILGVLFANSPRNPPARPLWTSTHPHHATPSTAYTTIYPNSTIDAHQLNCLKFAFLLHDKCWNFEEIPYLPRT